MSNMIELIDESENYTLQNHAIKHKDIIEFQNQFLFNFSNYRDGNKYWRLDTNTFDLITCNPKDAITIRNSLQKYAVLLNSENTNNKLTQLLLLQSNQYISEKWLGRYTINYGGGCFDQPVPLVHFGNKVFFQNQPVIISPGMFLLENYIPFHILKENSTDFIMENGKRKTFTNPITLKASALKGVHTVKGEIMIKQKGELIPKPFEFRYIVE